MKLMDYLYETHQTIKQFANSLGYHAGTMSNILHGRTKPSPRLIYNINRATEGKISCAEDLLMDK